MIVSGYQNCIPVSDIALFPRLRRKLNGGVDDLRKSHENQVDETIKVHK